MFYLESRRSVVSTMRDSTHERLLKVDPRNLLPETELKKVLGKGFGRPEEKRFEKAHRIMIGKIVKVKPNWPPLRHTGLRDLTTGKA